MRALTWQGKHDVRVETVPDPQIVNPRDAIIRITSTAICGSDLHLYDHTIPGMKHGDILGHEFMGEVVEVGSGNKKLKVGQRVVVPFVIACGKCFFCQKQQFAACDNSNPADKSDPSEMAYGLSDGRGFRLFASHGGYAGWSGEFARVPYSDVGPYRDSRRHRRRQGAVPLRHPADRLDGRVNCDIEPGDVVRCGVAARWACSPSRARCC
jgi:threonine dehydrogenase-like Zn-dependent dehydrogenase